MTQITNENIHLICSQSLVAYKVVRTNSLMKLQMLFADNWGFVNLSNPVGHINKNNTPSWIDKDFSTAQLTVKTILRNCPNTEIYLLSSLYDLPALL